jgi:hypothetical protein
MPELHAEPGEELTIISWMPRRQIDEPLDQSCDSLHEVGAVRSGATA